MRITDIYKHPITPFFEIHEENETGYKSLFAAKEVEPFIVVSELNHENILPTPTRYTVQIEEKQHMKLKPEYLQYTNHSCDPNVFFDLRKMVIISLRKIEKGEEITFFYPSTEWKMTEPFECCCGSKDCLRRIEGAVGLSKDILTKYRLNRYIIEKISSNHGISNFQNSNIKVMNQQNTADIIQSILIQNFNIQPENFDWNQSLEELDSSFKVLGHLVFLEQLLEGEFEKEIPILENITASYHTPKDLLQLIENQ